MKEKLTFRNLDLWYGYVTQIKESRDLSDFDKVRLLRITKTISIECKKILDNKNN
jgi:hypothetical protein